MQINPSKQEPNALAQETDRQWTWRSAPGATRLCLGFASEQLQAPAERLCPNAVCARELLNETTEGVGTGTEDFTRVKKPTV